MTDEFKSYGSGSGSTSLTYNNTSCCDRCGRSLNGKGYTVVNGWNICGICEWEESKENKS